jgi:hypothetical protein
MNANAREHVLQAFDSLLAHDGFGELRVEFRLLKRGQKEVILHSAHQHRYVVDFLPVVRPGRKGPAVP